jgi:nucleoside-diphosphate-sugar epimerase
LKVLITGAAGNLGSSLTQHLLSSPHELHLLLHKSPFPVDISGHPNIFIHWADLGARNGLQELCSGIDCIVHFAGVLFAPSPKKFLPKTNVGYVRNLADAAVNAGVPKFILMSFPHVEGETTPARPAAGGLQADCDVIHFRTRLQAERYLIASCRGTGTTPIILRAGVVYGSGVKLVTGACWMLRHRLMAIWKKPTWVHLIALPDFLTALQRAIESPGASGIYHICDDAPLTVQEFLNILADHHSSPHPWRLPAWMFHVAASVCEASSLLLRTPAFINRDIVKAGMTSSVGDNSRMKRDLLPKLAYRAFTDGVELLK